MTWGEIIEAIARKAFLAIAKVIVFIVWVILNSILILLTALTKTMKEWLFPGRK